MEVFPKNFYKRLFYYFRGNELSTHCHRHILHRLCPLALKSLWISSHQRNFTHIEHRAFLPLSQRCSPEQKNRSAFNLIFYYTPCPSGNHKLHWISGRPFICNLSPCFTCLLCKIRYYSLYEKRQKAIHTLLRHFSYCIFVCPFFKRNGYNFSRTFTFICRVFRPKNMAGYCKEI